MIFKFTRYVVLQNLFYFSFYPETDVITENIKVYAIYDMHIEISAQDFIISINDIHNDEIIKRHSNVSAKKVYRKGMESSILLIDVDIWNIQEG